MAVATVARVMWGCRSPWGTLHCVPIVIAPPTSIVTNSEDPPPLRTDAGRQRECHWTSFNCFHEVPDDGYLNAQFILETLQSQYVQITGPAEFGEVVLFCHSSGGAVYLGAIQRAIDGGGDQASLPDELEIAANVSPGVDSIFGGDGYGTIKVRRDQALNDTMNGGYNTDTVSNDDVSHPVVLTNFHAATTHIETWLGANQPILGTDGPD